jgi:phosphomannomutase
MSNPNTFNPNTDYSKFFKAYDLRGTVPHLTAEVYYWSGFALVTEVLIPENLPLDVNLMHDCRYSSPEFYQAMYWGIKDAGGNPQALGIGSSDMMYASCQVTGTSGAMITASHNPKDDNGCKILKTGSTMLGINEGLAKVRDFVVSKMGSTDFDLSNRSEILENTSLRTQTVGFFCDKIKQMGNISEVDSILKSKNKKLKIAVDSGNGMGGLVMEYLSKMYTNIEFLPLFWELDGNYPNHPADPQNYDNLKDLQQAVRNGADFGFAFDGDADRVFFVDEKANVINGDFLVAFFAKALLQSYHKTPNPAFNPAVVYIQPGSRCVAETIAENDGIAIPSKQGHTYIKAQMQKHKAIYGGEFSGHHYFADFGYLDSGVLAAVLMIKMLVEEDKLVSEAFAKLDKSYFISDLVNMTIPEGLTFEDVKTKILNHFGDATVSFFDGISVFYPDWKFSMRSSNTEPKIRFVLESRIVNQTPEKLALVRSVIGF